MPDLVPMMDDEDCWDAWFDGLAYAIRSTQVVDNRRILEPVGAIHYQPSTGILDAIPFPIGKFWEDDVE